MIEFSTDAYEAIVEHAREGVPREVCGVLGGEYRRDEPGSDASAEPSRVHAPHRTENVAATPERTYELDPEEQLAVMEEIEADGRAVVGFYHSHPVGPPKPSAVDETRATWSGYSYVIVLPGVPFVGSWRWNGERFVPEVVGLR